MEDYPEDEFVKRVDALAAELPEGSPVALFERAAALDSTGHSDLAVSRYQRSLDIYARRLLETRVTAHTLAVPGATLYYEVQGTGPVLLLLPGGGGDAAIFDVIAAPLAARYTVVTVDPRGYSRSRLDG